jgi:hypothetical protein
MSGVPNVLGKKNRGLKFISKNLRGLKYFHILTLEPGSEDTFLIDYVIKII